MPVVRVELIVKPHIEIERRIERADVEREATDESRDMLKEQ